MFLGTTSGYYPSHATHFDGRCPNCGYCPCCGRSTRPAYPGWEIWGINASGTAEAPDWIKNVKAAYEAAQKEK